MKSKKNTLFVATAAIILTLAILCFPAETKANDLTLYDNFNDVEFLDPDLWHTVQDDFKGGLDAIRKINKGKKNNGTLVIGATSYSWEGGGSEFDTRFSNPGGGGPHNITAMQAKVKIKECVFNSCGPAWEQVAYPTFEMIGSFFSTGLGAEDCDDQEGWNEVHALIGLQPKLGTEGKIFDVMASIFGMPDYITYDITHNLGEELEWTVEKGETVELLLRWDQASHSFIFQLNNEDPHAISYEDWLQSGGGLMTDNDPPCGGFKSIRPMIGFAQNCPDFRSMGSIELVIDDVRIESAPPWIGP